MNINVLIPSPECSFKHREVACLARPILIHEEIETLTKHCAPWELLGCQLNTVTILPKTLQFYL